MTIEERIAEAEAALTPGKRIEIRTEVDLKLIHMGLLEE